MPAVSLHNGYARSVADALDVADPRDAVERVKRVVIAELESVDRTVAVHATAYFNHTFVPDLVLSWPRDGDVSREVFLRFTDDIGYLAEGMSRLDSRSPMIVGLGDLPTSPEGRLELSHAADDRSGLVLDQGGLGILAATNAESPVTTLLSNALAQSGLGVLDAVRAETVTRVVASGFDGARNLQAGATGEAVKILGDVLSPRGTSRMGGFLQAVWVGSGGRADLFPGQITLGGSLNDQTLEFLLSFEEVQDDEFWSRIGREVTLRQLSELSVEGPSPNLQRMVRANLDHLWCRGCIVTPEDLPLSEDAPPLAWSVEGGFLQLRGVGVLAGFSEDAEQARSRGATQRSDGLSVEDLRRRARGAVLESLTMSDRANQMAFGSESHDDVVQGERLRELADTFGPGARVQQAVAARPSGQRSSLDFRLGVATGITKSKPLMADLARVAPDPRRSQR